MNMQKRGKRAQAAMEFLMTYGWAILVVLIVIGALAYFGVLNPQQFLPRKCQFAQGIVCQDHIVSDTTGVTLQVNNGLGNDIDVGNITFTSDSGYVNCVTNSTVTIASGQTVTITMNNGSTGGECVAQTVGTRIRGNLLMNYRDLQSGFYHRIQGTMLSDIEP